MGIKGLVESGYLNSIPPEYVFPSNLNDLEVEEVPTVDFSQLTAGTPDERSKAIQVIGKACREWGFFMVTFTTKLASYLIFILFYFSAWCIFLYICARGE